MQVVLYNGHKTLVVCQLWPAYVIGGGHYIFALQLWSPYVIGQSIIFSSCFFLLLSFFSSPNLCGRRLDVYHTSAHGVALVRIQNACLKCAARMRLAVQREIQDAKNRHLGTIAQLFRAISSQLRHLSTIGKNLLNSNISPTSLQYGELRTTSG